MAKFEFNYRDMLLDDIRYIIKNNPYLSIEESVKKALSQTGRKIIPRVVKDLSETIEKETR